MRKRDCKESPGARPTTNATPKESGEEENAASGIQICSKNFSKVNRESTIGIILIAGEGMRFNHPTPKQFHRLCGKPIYQHTLQTFLQSQLFDEIVLVCHPDHLDQIPPGPYTVIPGGSTRQESVFRALSHCKTADYVLIHDGARALVTPQILRSNIAAVKVYKAVDTCIPSSDTLVVTHDAQTIDSIPDRRIYYRGQTPQTFAYPLILQAHNQALADGITNATDDCQLVHRLDHPVHIIAGSEDNIKITSTRDLAIAEQLLMHQFHTPHPTHSLENKTFVITGGTGGIGKALIEQLEREGARAIPLSRSSTPIYADLSSYEQTQAAFEQIHREFGKIDGLINAVGTLTVKPHHELNADEIQKLIHTNFNSIAYACKFAHLQDTASIVNIASSAYSRGRKNYALYSAAKAAVVNFTQGLAEERPEMSINVLVPPAVNTPMRKKNFPDEDCQEHLSPDDVAQQIVNILKNPTDSARIVPIHPQPIENELYAFQSLV